MKKLLIGTACVVATGGLMAAAMPVHQPMPMGPHGWYAGVGINYSTIVSETYTSNNGGTKYWLDRTNAGKNVFVGYRLSRYFGNELNYSYFGHRVYRNVAGNKTSTHNTWAMYYDALAFLPLHQNFEFFVKGGVDTYHAVTANVRSGTYDRRAKIKAFGANFGAGLQFNWRMLGVRAQYTNYEAFLTNETQTHYDPTNLLSLDVLYRFG